LRSKIRTIAAKISEEAVSWMVGKRAMARKKVIVEETVWGC
jgi:phosphoribosyl-ATP pyrophosphohydrolase